MPKVNDVLSDVLQLLPCMQVNRAREVNRRFKVFIEANGEYWLPNEVTHGMLQSLGVAISIDRPIRYEINYPDPYEASSNVELLNTSKVIEEIRGWRRNKSVGFAQRRRRVVGVLLSYHLFLGERESCNSLCSRHCPSITSRYAGHIASLSGKVTIEEMMTMLSNVHADHYELFTEGNSFSTWLISRLLLDDKIKSARSLAVDNAYAMEVPLWGRYMRREHLANYFCSAGNPERVLILRSFKFSPLHALRVVQEFCAASATKDFARVVYVEIKESTRSQCSDLLKALGHVPLAIRTGPTADTSIFIFKSRRSRDTLSLRLSRQGFVKSGYTLNGLWARFKRHADTHSVDDLLYDG